jgi:rhodanese-related sulfurtransferase
VSNLSPADFAQRLKGESQALLLDVRTPGEFAGGHLPGAKNLNFNSPSFQQEVSRLDRSQPVYLYCAVGGRSASAAALMKKMGFQVLYNMSGGFSQWSAQGLPSER